MTRSDDALATILLERLVISFEPSWLWLSAEDQFDPDDPPLDLLHLAEVLGIPEGASVVAARQAARKVDLEARALFGAAGELAVVRYVERNYPRASIEHVSQFDDSCGYDIHVELGAEARNLEVKSVSSSKPRRIFVSRHELEIANLDPSWRLIIVELDGEGRTVSVGTVSTTYLCAEAPADASSLTRWESTQYRLPARVIESGFDLRRDVF
ncbi:protein NO VEIN domain-containing protein [Rhodococcoides kroppenstedtii]|uniref:protein NO VEIN domain-containing protein n=1 Tax=Rhodococcoides kroppenstedtii TaxID=293050 RepID=UPI001BDF216C|nr:DUF3883 domain-containing protein [Rhodococcus kroppenstedtii]MBT1192050.1 DUF3883 domain-containing protein [Rhodococcus kroppenstedtii]